MGDNGKKVGLLAWKDILPWQKDNEYILTGYRQSRAFFKYTMRQATNIWSHLIGALQFLLGLLRFLHFHFSAMTSDRPLNMPDVAAVSVYYLCVVVCFALSTAFHTLSDHSAPLHRFGNQLDHLGIVLVMWGTGVSGTHFALRCAPASLRILYFSAVTATAAGCAVFTLQPRFRTPSFRTARFLMYCFLGASLFAPVVHAWRGFGGGEDGLAAVSAVMGLRSFLGLALVNFAGAAVYAARVPERWFPGTFDLLGQSHNWMHVLVFTGALIRLSGLLEVCDGWAAEGGLAVYCQGAN
ncbi:adiponectin receptor protein 1 [Purpureocillium lilacinum]|uniref:Adiponectin receptor protein 1 n=1 Tax=Purpureocillium lilacinum TaxID=33203 RepID=A0A179H9L3_PURLI|nr:adiponectin receptor protein 1 [Purpureocillium lilacinum]